jgi:hypothetical protein
MAEPTQPPSGGAEGLSSPEFIYGAAEIAHFLGVSIRKVYYWTERRRLGKSEIPINNLPSVGLCANRKTLVDYLNGTRQV